MTYIYKIVNDVAPPFMNSLFEFRSNEDFRRTANDRIEIITYRAPSLWAKLSSECKLAASLEEF